MSHLTTHKTKCSDRGRVARVARDFGWSIEQTDTFQSRFGQTVTGGAAVLKDKNGREKMVIGPDGTVRTDAYYMGRDYEKFMQAYAADHIREKAVGAGGMVTGTRTDPKTGELVMEVQFA